MDSADCLLGHVIYLVWKIERKQPSLLAILPRIYFMHMTPCYKCVAIRKTILSPPYKKQTVLILIVLLKNLYIFLPLFQLVFPCVFFSWCSSSSWPYPLYFSETAELSSAVQSSANHSFQSSMSACTVNTIFSSQKSSKTSSNISVNHNLPQCP